MSGFFRAARQCAGANARIGAVRAHACTHPAPSPATTGTLRACDPPSPRLETPQTSGAPPSRPGSSERPAAQAKGFSNRLPETRYFRFLQSLVGIRHVECRTGDASRHESLVASSQTDESPLEPRHASPIYSKSASHRSIFLPHTTRVPSRAHSQRQQARCELFGAPEAPLPPPSDLSRCR